jgi:hypothetical protein
VVSLLSGANSGARAALYSTQSFVYQPEISLEHVVTHEQMRCRQQLDREAKAGQKRGDSETAAAKMREANLIYRRAQGGDPWAAQTEI